MVSDITTLIIFSFLIFTEVKLSTVNLCPRGVREERFRVFYYQSINKQTNFKKNTVYRVIFALLYLDSRRQSCVERKITEDLEFAS